MNTNDVGTTTIQEHKSGIENYTVLGLDITSEGINDSGTIKPLGT